MRRGALLALGAALALGCERGEPTLRADAPQGAQGQAAIPVTELEPGAVAARPPARNPYEGDPRQIAEGERFYTWFNCGGCHGAQGGGGIGPPLRDERWIYGGRPDQVFLSIVQGRPQGMPAYGGRIPDDTLWKIVAFVQSFGGMGGAQGGGASPTEEGGSP